MNENLTCRRWPTTLSCVTCDMPPKLVQYKLAATKGSFQNGFVSRVKGWPINEVTFSPCQVESDFFSLPGFALVGSKKNIINTCIGKSAFYLFYLD